MQKEYVLSVDDFKQPKILTGKDAIATLLIRLLLLQPGTIPDRPEMGVGLVENYRYSMKDRIEDLKVEIQNQISTYLPRYQGADVAVKLNDNNTLSIGISIDGVLYKYETQEQNDNEEIMLSRFKAEY